MLCVSVTLELCVCHSMVFATLQGCNGCKCSAVEAFVLPSVLALGHATYLHCCCHSGWLKALYLVLLRLAAATSRRSAVVLPFCAVLHVLPTVSMDRHCENAAGLAHSNKVCWGLILAVCGLACAALLPAVMGKG
jgi:hypothetical protein